ncbi:endolytic transglycosylase MltG [Amycolatopsis sp., V23-08]|uniref:Endolytic murein transglycosylase n=1 Tax=Amycolatopsis heterodermiae TaxID=3110235 RepID=A0ABU5RJ10_9PSEU|nr:endolytic transglycosylase MltG [Amycolatopsis sp., V23-08]MEA5366168.1 endolytic transglycosylase MltG [Amycolatopsis sp., V23-08]
MNDEQSERPRGRRRLREPEDAAPPPSRPAPRRADPRDPRAAEARRAQAQSGYHELPQPSRRPQQPSGPHEVPPPSRRAQPPSGQYELPQPSSRRAAPDPRRDAPQTGRRRRLEPPDTLPPVDDELDPQARRAAPARAAHARYDLDEGSEVQAPAGRRRRPEPDEADVQPPRRRRPVPEPEEAAEAPKRRRPAPEPDEVAEAPRRRRPEPVEDEAPQRRRSAAEPPPAARRSVQPGDRSVGVPAPGAEPPRRRRPPPPPVREEPVTDIIPAQAPPPPAPEPVRAPAEDDLFADDDYDEYAEYDDYEGEYAEDGYDEPEYEEDYDDYEEEPKKPRKKKGKRALGWIAAVAVIVLLAGGAYYGFNRFFGYEDYDGAGDGDVLFQVDDGDSTSAIGTKLTTAGVVASSKAFVKAGADNPKLSKIQHGFYVMKSHMSGASAVDRIVSPTARVGQLEVRPYTQFDDITQPDGKVTPGVYSLMAKASCAQLNGKSTCVTADDLRKVVDGADLKTLGVPDWAVADANKADRKDRRLEGLIAPGLYDVRPGATAQEIVGQLVRSSTEAIQNAGLSPQSTGPGMTPYQTLIIASIIEREAVKADFGKLSRVIYNRLASSMRLQMDSTVNYVLDRPTLATNDADRTRAGAYNTYKIPGLTPTPISVPSPEAIQAAVHPVAGDWVYFVKCEKNGLSCFAVSFDDHRKNVDLAKERGVF